MIIYFFKQELLGEMSNYIIRQSPLFPDNLTDILKAFDVFFDEHFEEYFIEKVIPGMCKCEEIVLRNFIYKTCHKIPEIKMLNASKKEIEAGLKLEGIDNDVLRGNLRRERKSIPEWDFIDLGALARNVYQAIESANEKTRSVKI